MGRTFLFAGAALLLVTAFIHAGGQPMVDGWTAGLDHRQAAAICLVWITDSIDWAVVALIWALAGWQRKREWLLAAAVAALIPLAGGVGVMLIDSSFFGGWLILASVALAGIGLALGGRAIAKASSRACLP